VGGTCEGVFKHLTGEGWASDTVDREHGTGIDHIESAPHPVTKVGYTAVTVVVVKGRNTTVLVICVSG
jgi:hypothetical protein